MCASPFLECLLEFPCKWNYRPDHCIYGSNCASAEESGIYILHGNRGVYHDHKQPAFRAVYEAIRKVRVSGCGMLLQFTLCFSQVNSVQSTVSQKYRSGHNKESRPLSLLLPYVSRPEQTVHNAGSVPFIFSDEVALNGFLLALPRWNEARSCETAGSCIKGEHAASAWLTRV